MERSSGRRPELLLGSGGNATGGARRRRLTLAPCPVGKRCDLGTKPEFKVRDAIFADSDGSEEDREELKSCSPADPLSGLRKMGGGSRFWPLADELSSDEEEETAPASGTAMLLTSDKQREKTNMESCTQQKMAWHIDTETAKPSKRSGTGTVGERRSPSIRPWKGPLPKSRTSPKLSLGDIRVQDGRARGRKTLNTQWQRMADVGSRQGAAAGVLPEGRETREEVPDPDAVNNFEFCRTEESPGGPVIWAGKVGYVHVGAQKLFRGSTALGWLLSGGGKLKRSSSNPGTAHTVHPHSTLISDECKQGAGEMWRAGGGGFGGGPGRGYQAGRAPVRGGGGGAGFGREAGSDVGRQERFGWESQYERGRRAPPAANQRRYDGGGAFQGRLRAGYGGRMNSRGFGQKESYRQEKEWSRKQEQAHNQENTGEGKREAGRGLGTQRRDNTSVDDEQKQDGDVRMEDTKGQGEEEAEESRAGAKCIRCTKRGHLEANCTAVLYCVICNVHNEHMNHRCPILKMPRPVANAVGYAVHGLGFFHIPHPPLPRARKDSKMALIRVEGGLINVGQVAAQLKRLFGGKWKWEVAEQDESSFITKFPSKIELQRAIAFGGADVKEDGVNMGIRMNFEMWHGKQEGYLLPKVWVRVYGMRNDLREFLELWAVGSMLGSTQTVDMEMTRKNDFGRIYVACLNPLLIPAKLDVVVGDHYFELEFEVERKGMDENGEEAEFNWTGNAVEEMNGAERERARSQEEINVGRETKRLRSCTDSIEEEKEQEHEGWDWDGLKEEVQNMSREEFTKFLEAQAKKIIDVATTQVIEEVADKVMKEDDDDLPMGEYGAGEEVSDEGETGNEQMGRKEKEKEMRDEAAIPEVMLTPTRCSPRLVHSVDEHTLSRAERRVAERNLEQMEGHIQRNILGKKLGTSL